MRVVGKGVLGKTIKNMRKDTKAYQDELFKNRFGRKPRMIEKKFMKVYGKIPTKREIKNYESKKQNS